MIDGIVAHLVLLISGIVGAESCSRFGGYLKGETTSSAGSSPSLLLFLGTMLSVVTPTVSVCCRLWGRPRSHLPADRLRSHPEALCGAAIARRCVVTRRGGLGALAGLLVDLEHHRRKPESRCSELGGDAPRSPV